MACRNDYPPDYGQAEINAGRFGLHVNDFGLMVAVSCMACEALQRANVEMPPLVHLWWTHHLQQDAKRKEEASVRAARDQAEREASEFLRKRLKELGG